MKNTKTLSLTIDEKKIPLEVLLFKFGLNETTKGDVYLTEDSANQIIAAWKDWGNKLNIDYNHAQLFSVNPDESISGGTYDLEIREDGLYATNINWTDRAREKILAREYLYLSPAFDVNDNNEVIELINFALTNLPATKNMNELLAAFKLYLGETMVEEENKSEELAVDPSAVDPNATPEAVPSEDEAAMEVVDEVESLRGEVARLNEMIVALKEFVGFVEPDQTASENVDEIEVPEDKVIEPVVDEETVELKKTVETLSREIDLTKAQNKVMQAFLNKQITPAEIDVMNSFTLKEVDEYLSKKGNKKVNLSHNNNIVDRYKNSDELSIGESDDGFRARIKGALSAKK